MMTTFCKLSGYCIQSRHRVHTAHSRLAGCHMIGICKWGVVLRVRVSLESDQEARARHHTEQTTDFLAHFSREIGPTLLYCSSTRTHTRVSTRIPPYAHTPHTYAFVHTHACTHTQACVYVRTYTHTRMHRHNWMDSWP